MASRLDETLDDRLDDVLRRLVSPAPTTSQARLDDLLQVVDPLTQRPDCPAPATLERLAAGTLRPRAVAGCLAHLTECDRCRQYAETLREARLQPAPRRVSGGEPTEPAGVSSAHWAGVVFLGLLLLLANSPLLDAVLAFAETPPTVAAVAAAPAGR